LMKKRLKVFHVKLKIKEKKKALMLLGGRRREVLKDERIRRRATTCVHGEVSSTLLGRAE